MCQFLFFSGILYFTFTRSHVYVPSLHHSGGEQTDIKPGAAAALTASGPRTLTEQDHVDIVASAVNLLTHQQRVEFLAQMKVRYMYQSSFFS